MSARSPKPAAPKGDVRHYRITRCETLPKPRRGKAFRTVLLAKGTIPYDTPKAVLARLRKLGEARLHKVLTNPSLTMLDGRPQVNVQARKPADIVALRLRRADLPAWIVYAAELGAPGVVILAGGGKA
jgi:hypothetical protein